MLCNKCGAQIPEGSIFCTNCGSIVETSSEANNNDVMNGFNNEGNINQNFGDFSNLSPVENKNDFSNNTNNFNEPVNNQNFNQNTTGQSFNNYSFNQLDEKPKRNINFKLIGLIVGILVVIGVVIAVALPFITGGNEKKQIKNIEGLSIYIPESFVTNNDGQYDASYGETDDSLMVAVKTFNNSSYSTNEYSKLFVELMKQKGYKCDASSSKSINKNKWQYTKCEYLGAQMYIYITTKNEKLYFVLTGATKQAGDKGVKYNSKVEKYLDFASDKDI